MFFLSLFSLPVIFSPQGSGWEQRSACLLLSVVLSCLRTVLVLRDGASGLATDSVSGIGLMSTVLTSLRVEARRLGSEPLSALSVFLALWIFVHSGALLYYRIYRIYRSVLFKFIIYEDDLNCCLITIDEDTGNGLTLEETAKRVGLSFVRVRQIEKLALKKLSKRMQDNKTGVF